MAKGRQEAKENPGPTVSVHILGRTVTSYGKVQAPATWSHDKLREDVEKLRHHPEMGGYHPKEKLLQRKPSLAINSDKGH